MQLLPFVKLLHLIYSLCLSMRSALCVLSCTTGNNTQISVQRCTPYSHCQGKVTVMLQCSMYCCTPLSLSVVIVNDQLTIRNADQKSTQVRALINISVDTHEVLSYVTSEACGCMLPRGCICHRNNPQIIMIIFSGRWAALQCV